MASKAKQPNFEIDINKVIESLTTQIAQQAQRIAVLEATVAALNEAVKDKDV